MTTEPLYFSVDYIVILPGAIENNIVHFECDEWLYVLSGELQVFINERKKRVKEGDSVQIPRGTIHGSKNESAQKVNILSVCSPPFKLEYMNKIN